MTRANERGFIVYDEFLDTYGGSVRVQESSHVEPRVWVFVDANSPNELRPGEGSMHLDKEGVDRLIAALQNWKRDQEA